MVAASEPWMPTLVVPRSGYPMRLRLSAPFDDDGLLAFCAANRDLQIEQTADGELIIMPPTGGETSHQNSEIVIQLGVWAKQNGTGLVFDSNGGFRLSNGAVRAPDAAWVRRVRWDALSADARRRFPPLDPDFVVELRSPNDALAIPQAKLVEYIACGVRLGWLVDPLERRVHVYRPGAATEVLDDPVTVDAAPELPGFTLDLRSLW